MNEGNFAEQVEEKRARYNMTERLEEIENEIFSMEEKEISSNAIGELVMEKLKDLDQVAYVRFASVYREFKDVNTFKKELNKLLK